MKKLIACMMIVMLLVGMLPMAVGAASGLESKLLGEWNFDDETTGTATLYNNADTATGTYVDGISGKALKLSTQGTDEKFWLNIPYSVFGDNKDSFTLSIWYYANGYKTTGEETQLFSLYNTGTEKMLVQGINKEGSPKMWGMKWDGTYGHCNLIGAHKQNEWVNLIYCVDVVDGQNKVTAYVNGVAIEADSGNPSWANSLLSEMGFDSFTIGGHNKWKADCIFYGMVDEIQLYAGALNAGEAARLYDSYMNPPAPDGTLLGEWNFDDDTTGTATLYNDAAEVAGTYVDGVSGKALKLSTKGTGEKFWLSVPYSVFGNNKDSFTLSIWYNSTGYNDGSDPAQNEQSELFTLYNSTADKQLWYGIRTNGHQDADGFKWNGNHGWANVIGGYKQNEWVHLVYCVDNVDGQTKISAFINGVAVEVDQNGNWADSLMSQMGMDTFTIGGKNPYKGGTSPKCTFYGSIDEVKLYAGALSADQAKAIYDAELPKAEEPPVDEPPVDEPPMTGSTGIMAAVVAMLMSATGVVTLIRKREA